MNTQRTKSETDITDIKHLIRAAAAAVITETMTKPGKTEKYNKQTHMEYKNTKANKQMEKRTVHSC